MKQKLSIDEQIAHLRAKGVQFRLMSENAARAYLQEHSNYFKLASYRKNYQKHPGGAKAGQYIDLDFAYLVDLAEIDMHLRYQVVHMALDVEHHVKLRLLHLVDESDEDGYEIVQDFVAGLDVHQQRLLRAELERNRTNTYCGDLVRKYERAMPIWVFVELIPFGRLISLYKFCGKRFDVSEMEEHFYRLRQCKELRNAAAHSNCVLNDLHTNTVRYRSKVNSVMQALAEISTIRKGFRQQKMKNERLQQIVTLLYMHKLLVTSVSMHEREAVKLHDLLRRIDQHIDYYEHNELVASSFIFLREVIDSWFAVT